MPKDRRILDRDGRAIDFTCENKKYRTDLSRGSYPGKVLESPLYSNNRDSLWLEHVIDVHSGEEVFWFMWYKDGQPLLPASGVFRKNDLRGIIKKLNTIKPSEL